jgi:GNAT superfamily N-acetyltransferase
VGTLRRATPADAEDLTRLRGLMHESMGATELPAAWREACTAAFRQRLDADEQFAVYGVDVDGRLVSCGAGWIEHHLPSPKQLDGRRGHIASMSTEPEWQRRGFGRDVFRGLLSWFAAAEVPRIDLRATDMGRPLYEEFGFRVLGGATMAWTAPGVTVGMP